MALGAHLRGHFAFGRHCAHGPRLADVVADRLFAIDIDPEFHRDQRRQGVMMIRRGDEHRVNLTVKLVKHLPVIRENL
jgi:hypothetical protein